MGSNFHYTTIDLNEDQNHQPFFASLESSLHQQQFHHQAPSNPLSLLSPSLSYFPFLIDSHQDQVYVGYNNNTFHGGLDAYDLSQPLETKKFVLDGGSSSSDQMVPKKEARLKLTIKKKDIHHDQTHFPQHPIKGKTGTDTLKWVSSKVRLMKKKKSIITTTDSNKQHVNNDQSFNQSNLERDLDHIKKISTNQYNTSVNKNGYNGSNYDCVVRICSDCNTTKTPLWRSGPRGPKSLCNACGIRQRKARRAAATATTVPDVWPPVLKKKMQNKNKRSSNGVYNLSSPSAKRMITVKEATSAEDSETQSKSTMLSSSSSSDKFYFDDLAIILSKSSAYQQVFPQDEKEAAMLLMALSYGMVHG